VTTRWTWRGTHTGEFLGVTPTNKEVMMSGITVHRMRDGKIQEGWFNYDFLGALRQIGAVTM
jgi:predicted ester cyclase